MDQNTWLVFFFHNRGGRGKREREIVNSGAVDV